MLKKSMNNFILINFIILSVALIGLVKPIYSQSPVKDTTFHPYHVNYWVTSSILVAGITTELIGIPWIINKSPVTDGELQSLDIIDITIIDRWALELDPSNMDYYRQLSDYVLAGILVLPAITMFDHNIRQDWLDVLLMYLETEIITLNIYTYSPFGPTFVNKFRPRVYYDEVDYSDRTLGTNRNSFYSGHVAAAAAATFFTAKIFCDYHPELKGKKYLVYSAALIPPLILSYIRVRALSHFPSDNMVGLGVGILCGIIIPELHRLEDENISMGLYSLPEATGIAIRWQPNFLK